MDLAFRLLQEKLTPCYTKMSGATVRYQRYKITEAPKFFYLKVSANKIKILVSLI